MKRWTCVMIASALVLTLSGCGLSNTNSKDSENYGSGDIQEEGGKENNVIIEETNVNPMYKESADKVLAVTYKATEDSIADIEGISWAQGLLAELRGLNEQYIDINKYCEVQESDTSDITDPPEVLDNSTSVTEDSFEYTEEEELKDSDFIRTLEGKPVIYINDLAFDRNGYSSFDYNGVSWWVSKDEFKKTWREIAEESRTYEYMTYAVKDNSIKLAYMEIKTGDIAEIEFTTSSTGEIVGLNFRVN